MIEYKSTYGIDLSEDSSKTIITVAGARRSGKTASISAVFIDEYGRLAGWKWYRNPIKWLRFRHIMRIIKKRLRDL